MDRIGLDFKPLIRALRQLERAHNATVAVDPGNLSESQRQHRDESLQHDAIVHEAVRRALLKI
jgi:hypothetical protein